MRRFKTIIIQDTEIVIPPELDAAYTACMQKLENHPEDAQSYYELGFFYEALYLQWVGFGVNWDINIPLKEALGTFYVGTRLIGPDHSGQILEKIEAYRASPTKDNYRAAKVQLTRVGLPAQGYGIPQTQQRAGTTRVVLTSINNMQNTATVAISRLSSRLNGYSEI